MKVVLRKMASGRSCRFMAWGEEASCDLFDFLQGLRRSNLAAHQKVQGLMERCAEHGLPRGNEQKCRYFRDIGAFELKTGDGVRIMAFWDEDFLVVCTHAFMKKSQKTKPGDLERLRIRKKEYFDAKRAGTLTIE